MTSENQPTGATDLGALKDELRYCLDNGMYGPRTGAALLWALELVEDIEKQGEAV
ncbi:hypothetical protein AB4Y43_01010 [Paraburkholderia sp. BR10872]|uniref:hypothetical protein n=1 Tax=Paraburkholderia sp. BR10872 TaxID=3236989 RepID=UPI0034D15BDF